MMARWKGLFHWKTAMSFGWDCCHLQPAAIDPFMMTDSESTPKPWLLWQIKVLKLKKFCLFASGWDHDVCFCHDIGKFGGISSTFLIAMKTFTACIVSLFFVFMQISSCASFFTQHTMNGMEWKLCDRRSRIFELHIWHKFQQRMKINIFLLNHNAATPS